MREHQESIFTSKDHTELYYQSWHPANSPVAVLVIIHGLGGHSGLFTNIVNYLLPLNYAIYACDLRGHGRSLGQRGHIDSWRQFEEDIGVFLGLIATQQPGCPKFLLGHSLGAVIVLDYALRYPQSIQGVIALAAPLGGVGVSPLKVLTGRCLSKLWPNFTLNTGIHLEAGTRDQKVLLAYAVDPLRHTQGTARLANEFFLTVDWLQRNAADLRVPLLMLHGGQDCIAPPQGTYQFFVAVPPIDKEWREYPEAYHELQNELNYQEIIGDLANWLEKHRDWQNANPKNPPTKF